MKSQLNILCLIDEIIRSLYLDGQVTYAFFHKRHSACLSSLEEVAAAVGWHVEPDYMLNDLRDKKYKFAAKLFGLAVEKKVLSATNVPVHLYQLTLNRKDLVVYRLGSSVVKHILFFARAYLEVLFDFDSKLRKPRFSLSLLSIIKNLLPIPLSSFIPVAKYATVWPLAKYLRNPLPETPLNYSGHPLIFSGVVRTYLKNRLNSRFNRHNLTLFVSISQGVKRGAATVPDSFVLEAMQKHKKILSTPPEPVSRERKPTVVRILRNLSKNFDVARSYHLRDGSTKACAEAPRSYGGARQFLMDGRVRDSESTSFFNSVCQSNHGYLIGMFESSKTKKPRRVPAAKKRVRFEDQIDLEMSVPVVSYAPPAYQQCVLGPVGDTEDVCYGQLHPQNYYEWLLEYGLVQNHRLTSASPGRLAPRIWQGLYALRSAEPHVPGKVVVAAVPEPLKVRLVTKGQALEYHLAKGAQEAQWGHLKNLTPFVLTSRPLDVSDLYFMITCEGKLKDFLLSRGRSMSMERRVYRDKVGERLQNSILKEYWLRGKPLTSLNFYSPSDSDRFEAPRSKPIWASTSRQARVPIDIELPNDFFVSGDYSSATDRLNLNYTKLIFQSFFPMGDHNDPWPTTPVGHPDFRKILRTVLYEQMVHYPKNMVEKDPSLKPFLQQNGQLMGSILSFPNLCCANLLTYLGSLAEYLANRYGLSPSWLSKVDLNLLPVLINGDDILFRSNKDHYDLWRSWSSELGFELSLGKNFTHPTALTVNSQFFTYSNNEFTPVAYFNAGVLTGQSKLGNSLGKDPEPIWALYECCLEGAQNKWRAHKRFVHYYRPLIDSMTNQGEYSLFLPRTLGGLGFKLYPEVRKHVTFTPFQLRFATFLKEYVSQPYEGQYDDSVQFQGLIPDPDTLRSFAEHRARVKSKEFQIINLVRGSFPLNKGCSVAEKPKNLLEKLLMTRSLVGHNDSPNRTKPIDSSLLRAFRQSPPDYWRRLDSLLSFQLCTLCYEKDTPEIGDYPSNSYEFCDDINDPSTWKVVKLPRPSYRWNPAIGLPNVIAQNVDTELTFGVVKSYVLKRMPRDCTERPSDWGAFNPSFDGI